MLLEKKLIDMTDFEKIEATEELNTIADDYQRQYDNAIESVNKRIASVGDMMKKAIEDKREVMNSDLEFQDKLQNRMIGSMRALNELQKEMGGSAKPNPPTSPGPDDDLVYF